MKPEEKDLPPDHRGGDIMKPNRRALMWRA
jgi:hypothetical protein